MNEENIEHVGDGVYAEWNGFQIVLRVNHHENEPAVYLEPFVMKRLIEFYEKYQNQKHES